MGKKWDLSDFESGMVVVPDGLIWEFQKLLIYWDFHAQPSLGFTENGSKKRKYPVSCSCVDENALLRLEENGTDCLEIIEGLQNTISEHTTCRTLKQMGYSSRRPHRVPLLSDKNRKRRLQFAHAHQNWTIEDCKNVAWSDDESRFLLRHSDGRVRIWRIEHEIMDPSCLVSMVQAGGGAVMVWGIFSWYTLGPLVPIEPRLNSTSYLSIVADHVHPFMTTVYPSSDGFFQQDIAPCHKAQIISLQMLTSIILISMVNDVPQHFGHLYCYIYYIYTNRTYLFCLYISR